MRDEKPTYRCGYIFDPERWEATQDERCFLTAEDLNEEGVWRCPHERDESDDYCPFHRSDDASDESLADEFLRAIEGERATAGDSTDSKQFVGATFGTLDLAYAILDGDDTRPIDLRHATVRGDLRATAVRVRNPLLANGLTVRGETDLRNATFEKGVDFVGGSFEGAVQASLASVEDEANFENATFHERGTFRQTTFESDCRFDKATFHRKAKFTTATFGGEATFRRTVFQQYGWFEGAQFATGAHFLSGTTFEGKAWFANVTFEGKARFRNVRFDAEARFPGAVFEDVEFRPTEAEADLLRIDLRESSITTGSLEQGERGRVVYDVRDATLGDVTVSADGNPFTRLDIRDTTFDGFDFGRREHRAGLEASGWSIHSTLPETSRSPRLFEDGDEYLRRCTALEGTYLKAKNGANAIGYDKAAAEFFRHQMVYRRKARLCRAVNGDGRWPRAKALSQWLANLLFGLAAGHGERPSRVLGLSAFVVVSFAALFSVVWRGPPPYGHPAGYLLLSIESFVTLVLGGAAQVVSPWWLRLVGEIEGFVGAFLVALFVFTLTRSIER